MSSRQVWDHWWEQEIGTSIYLLCGGESRNLVLKLSLLEARNTRRWSGSCFCYLLNEHYCPKQHLDYSKLGQMDRLAHSFPYTSHQLQHQSFKRPQSSSSHIVFCDFILLNFQTVPSNHVLETALMAIECWGPRSPNRSSIILKDTPIFLYGFDS